MLTRKVQPSLIRTGYYYSVNVKTLLCEQNVFLAINTDQDIQCHVSNWLREITRNSSG